MMFKRALSTTNDQSGRAWDSLGRRFAGEITSLNNRH